MALLDTMHSMEVLKDLKRRADQENLEIMNYLSVHRPSVRPTAYIRGDSQ